MVKYPHNKNVQPVVSVRIARLRTHFHLRQQVVRVQFGQAVASRQELVET